MGIIDTVKNLLSGHDKEVDQMLGKVGDTAKTRFAGHDDQIDGLVGQARQRTGDGDTTTSASTSNPEGPDAATPTTGPVEGEERS
ncbi:antitoxin [Dermatophilaceae bacterium Sec6.4]